MLTVCIIEDQKVIRERVSAHIDNLPLVKVLQTFESAERALEVLPVLKPQLTIMDIGLPGMTGTEALARLTSTNFQGDVIMFTIYDDADHLFRALELGAVGYVLKEDGIRGIERAIDEYRRGGGPMSRGIALRVLKSFSEKSILGRSPKLEMLTLQQETILKLLSEGLLNKEIASKLGLTEGTIKQHNIRIYRKLSVNNRAEAIRLYLTNQGY